MDFMFRIPRWLFSLLLVVSIGPIVTLLGLEIYLNVFNLNHADYSFSWINRHVDEFLLASTLCLVLVFLWMIAIIFRQCKTELLAAILAIPAVFSVVILGVTFSTALHDMHGISLLPQAVFNYLDDLITINNVEKYIIGSFGIFLLATMIGITSLTRLLGKRLIDRFFIPLQVIFLPIGIWWLQPKLAQSTRRKANDQAVDHLLE